MYITWTDLFQLVDVICSVISLVVMLIHKKGK